MKFQVFIDFLSTARGMRWIWTLLLTALPALCFAQNQLPRDCYGGSSSGLDAALEEMGMQHRDLMGRRGRVVPESYLQVGSGRLLSKVSELERILPGARLLVYARNQDRLCIWLFDSNGNVGTTVSPISLDVLRGKLEYLRSAIGVDRLQLTRAPHRRGLTVKPAAPVPPASASALISEVSEALLPGALHDGLSRTSHLVVIPVLELGTVPFSLLQAGKDAPALVERMSVTIFPSVVEFVETLQMTRWEGIQPAEKALIVGNPDFSGDKEWMMPSLPGAEREAHHLAKIFNTPPLIGRDATAARVKQSIANADYIAIASHAIADASDPLDKSFIALAGSRLTAREIQSMRLKPSLAILSACQTGLGGTHDAGTIGIARAFTIAGSFGAVTSLWSVDDDATYLLMSSLVGHLKMEPPQEALRKAMLDTRKKHPDPAHWASFMYFGMPVGVMNADRSH